jgi:hypothetical protein
MRPHRAHTWSVFLIAASLAGPGEGAAGAAHAQKATEKGKDRSSKEASKSPRGAAKVTAPAKVKLSTRSPKPGDPMLITVTGMAGEPKGRAGKARLIFYPVRGGWQAVFAVPLEDQEGPKARPWPWLGRPPAEAGGFDLKVVVEGAGFEQTLTVRPHTFPEEAATVAPDQAEPPPEKVKVINADNAAVIAALRNSDPPMWTGRFTAPGRGKPTSPFGAWRRFNDEEYRSRHLGMDVAAKVGSPVRAAQRGTVALVRDGILMGGTVVVVHGAGLASTYFHLSDFAVKVGQEVERGAILGKVGLTGRTTGPHIHLGIWVPGGFVDPAVFLKLPISAPIAPPGEAGKDARRDADHGHGGRGRSR